MDNHVCPWWLAYTFDNRLRRLLHNPNKILEGLLSSGQTALDLGPGLGFFSIAMARIVGDEGRVIAADIQPEMLTVLRRRAEKAGVLSRIQLHQCPAPDRLELTELVDFALAFWMAHEVPNPEKFFKECRRHLKPEAHFLLVEPRVHVSAMHFTQLVEAASAAGLTRYAEPKITFSRTMLFRPTLVS
jgi:ubiquinone/menaquinone biosynthesis C-methylase UbiE